MRKVIVKERERICKICEKIKKELKEKKYKNLPSLKVSKSHGTIQYHSENHYISKKRTEYIETLARKEYYDKLLPDMESFLQKCDELILFLESGGIDKAFQGLCEGKRKLLTDVIYMPVAEQVKRFETESFDTGELPYEITAEIYTNKGEAVRSKSEKIIADELHRRKIPYHYEKPLVLNDRGKTVTLHPDFTVMNAANGKIIYIEHLGLMDQPEYFRNFVRKLSLFERNALLLGRDVLLLHESSCEPLNIRTLNQYLDEFFDC